jgi:hypothetical protein
MMTALVEWLLRLDAAVLHNQEEEEAYLRAQQRDITLLNKRMDEIERRHRSRKEHKYDDA